MNLLLIGYGKMGQLIEQIAAQRGHTVRSVDPHQQGATYSELSSDALHWASSCIDFSQPDVVLDNIKAVADSKTELVVGSTGWYEHRAEIETLIDEAGVGFLYASNFSIGVQLFMKVTKYAAKLIDRFPEYDVSGREIHHTDKHDSPSGTAETLTEILLSSLRRKDTAVFDTFYRKPLENELHFSSMRSGSHPGTHEIVFDSSADTISLTHTARGRDGFAEGAVIAAEWLRGKQGFFTIDDLIKERIASKNEQERG